MKKATLIFSLGILGFAMLGGCATTERQGVTVSKEDEMPVWIKTLEAA